MQTVTSEVHLRTEVPGDVDTIRERVRQRTYMH